MHARYSSISSLSRTWTWIWEGYGAVWQDVNVALHIDLVGGILAHHVLDGESSPGMFVEPAIQL